MAQLHRQSWNGDLSVVIEEEEESRDLFIPVNEQIVEKNIVFLESAVIKCF